MNGSKYFLSFGIFDVGDLLAVNAPDISLQNKSQGF